ncbi:MAG: T9SS type A sorting domain-containing protein [Flavobacteriaceae bacterium]|nr:T9SS type A sorting domain-containing protein [Flavobacteriaceae bacterium]
MKQNYTNTMKQLIILIALLIGTTNYAQNIKFTFMNAVNTNDGSNDFYEADVLIETNGVADFKVGSGQLYFNYNTAAFGTNVNAANRFEVTQPNGTIGSGSGDGYICGQFVDAAAAPVYGNFVINDNTTSRVSWSFSEVFSSETFVANNVTIVPAKLIHIKLEYIDVNQDPMVEFENNNSIIPLVTDQFFTICGSNPGPFSSADCTNFPPTQFLNAILENTGAVLSIDRDTLITNTISIYPNPATDIININSTIEINKIQLFDLLGKQVISTRETDQIEISHLPIGVYLLKAFSESGTITKKIIIE